MKNWLYMKLRREDFILLAVIFTVVTLFRLIPENSTNLNKYRMVEFSAILFTMFAIFHNIIYTIIQKSLVHLLLSLSFISALLTTTPMYTGFHFNDLSIQYGIHCFRILFLLAMMVYTKRTRFMKNVILILVFGFIPGQIIMVLSAIIIFRWTTLVLIDSEKFGTKVLLAVYILQTICGMLESVKLKGAFMFGFVLLTFTMLVINSANIQFVIKQAFIDTLTQIPNRLYLLQKISEISHYTVVMIDIDKFKSINDKYGHNVGDEVLKHVAKLLQNSIRSSDIVARWGGEEFCIILKSPATTDILERIRKNIDETPCGDIHVTISVGSSTDKDFNSALVKADKALYKAKETGRNRVCTTY